jgi:DNA polymerase-1
MPLQLTLEQVRRVLGPVLADAAIRKVGHDLKYTEVVFSRHQMHLMGADFDTMVASYLLDPEASHVLSTVAKRELDADLPTFDQITGKARGTKLSFEEIDCERATGYSAGGVECALRLTTRFGLELERQGLAKLMREIEMPLSGVLAGMEEAGVLVDFDQLSHLRKNLETQITALEAKARELAGEEFNPSSPRQLEVILFDKLKLKPIKRTKTARSTDAEVLEALAQEHPLPGVLLEHRQLTKLKGTYVDALPALVSRETGRIHTQWSQAVAATGRISSNDPNLQNIPIRTELGREIRRAFIAPKGARLVSADYSQIELRVLAHLSKDPVLVDAFQQGQDVHERTAMEVFRVGKNEVTEVMRRRAKTINFGVIYGMGEVALAKRLSIPRSEAAAFIEAYFERYAGVRKFMDDTLHAARRGEAVRTLFGRQRLLPNLRSSNGMLRAAAERIAQNTPIQGTAADLLKLAMIKLADPVVPGARMVLTVHDELVFEVPEADVKRSVQRVKEAMEGVFPLEVPLVVDVGAGANWGELE